jgi:cyclic-di-GMP-binding protein
MENESECGYGATIQTRDRDWLRVGALVGIRNDNGDDWSLGVVRRLSRLNETESSVGIEILPGKPLDVYLHGSQASASYMVNGIDVNGPTSTVHGLILNEGNAPAIVLDPLNYQRNAVFSYTQLHDHKKIQLGDLIEQGESWLSCHITWLD